MGHRIRNKLLTFLPHVQIDTLENMDAREREKRADAILAAECEQDQFVDLGNKSEKEINLEKKDVSSLIKRNVSEKKKQLKYAKLQKRKLENLAKKKKALE